MISVRKQLGLLASLVLLSNQAIFPLASRKSLDIIISNPPLISVKERDVESWSDLPSSFSSLDYVNIACSLAHNTVPIEGDCKAYSRAVFDTYQKLVRLNKRDDLVDNIRFASAAFINRIGHVWVEYRLDDESTYFRYETTQYTPPFILKELVPVYSVQTQLVKQVLSGFDEIRYEDFVTARSVWGSRRVYPTWYSIGKPGGTLRWFIE